MSRKAAESWWNHSARCAGEPPVIIPPDVAYYKLYPSSFGAPGVKEPVTWNQVMKQRRKRQALYMTGKRHISCFDKPALLWLFYCEEWFFNGWWLYIKTVKNDYSVNFRNTRAKELEQMCFDIFPLGVIAGLDYDLWCEEFYKKFGVANPKKHKKTAFAKVRVRIECGSIVKITKY
jgi:hypothetical protein